MLNRRYHFYFMLLSLGLPMAGLVGFYVAVMIYWFAGVPDAPEAAVMDLNALVPPGTLLAIIRALGFLWALSLFSIWIYGWNMWALYLSHNPMIRRRLRTLARFAPFLLWKEVRRGLLRSDQ